MALPLIPLAIGAASLLGIGLASRSFGEELGKTTGKAILYGGGAYLAYLAVKK